jgi:hypothetical protein
MGKFTHIWEKMHPHEQRKLKHVGKLSVGAEALYHVSELVGMHMGATIAEGTLLIVIIIHVVTGAEVK